MKLLPQTAPEVYEGFLCGDFVTNETENSFNQALEHVNRSSTVAGGLVGLTRTDSEIAGIKLTTRELSCRRTRKRCLTSEVGMRVIVIEISEKQECVELVSCFTRYEVFRRKENLVAVTTVDVAREEIKHGLLGAEEIGKTVVKDFV